MSDQSDPAKKTQNIVPLFVDLDGTLILGDVFIESIFELLRKNLLYLFLFPLWLIRGKAYVKWQIARRVNIDARFLPYNVRFFEFLKTEHATGRPLILATAAHRMHAEEVATYLDVFTGVIATDGSINLDGARKLDAIRRWTNSGEFDYAGNAHNDIVVWHDARSAIVVNACRRVLDAAQRRGNVERIFGAKGSNWKAYLRACRVHQWAKNFLLFVPLITAHQWFDIQLIARMSVAFLAFSLCASGIYVFNDLMDVPWDRRHVRKRLRPFASGVISYLHGGVFSFLLTGTGLLIAAWLPEHFFYALTLYLGATVAYSLYFKRKLLLDVLLLAGLHTLRVMAGAFAIGVALSFWLLAFSIFLFLSLALIKRCAELRILTARDENASAGRGYYVSDLQVLRTMGVTGGFIAVLVYALYINSADVARLYSSPQWLWLSCPVLLYWIGRIWIKEAHGDVDDDPIIYALRDPVSYVTLLLVAGMMVVAV